MIGQTISHYKILEKLGEGGMGEVYLAQDTSLGRQVALKFLPAEMRDDDIVRMRFVREAKSAAALDHPFICHIHETGESEGIAYIAMERVDGPTLREKLSHGPVLLAEALRIAVELAEALEEAHNRNIVHRDLKPSNVMLTAGGHIKVMDFGLATEGASGETSQTDPLTALTKEGQTPGTVPYMSPEQLQGKPVDIRSDLFSFGIILQEMLTGTHPFLRSTLFETANAILNESPPPLAKFLDDTSTELQVLLDRMLAVDRDSRVGSAREVCNALRALSARAAPASDTRSIQLLRRPAVIIAMAAIVVAIGITLWLPYQSRREVQRVQALIPEIENLATAGDHAAAYELAVQALEHLSDDAKLRAMMPEISDVLTVITEPEGANVSLQRYAKGSQSPSVTVMAGTTPIVDLRIPRADYRMRLEKEGFITLEHLISSALNRAEARLGVAADIVLEETLPAEGTIPGNMVLVPAGKYRLRGAGFRGMDAIELEAFHIDKYEVTNEEYIEFIRAAAYSKRSFWKYPFVHEGVERTFGEAMSRFTDRSGMPGPREWSNQEFPAGKGKHPVTGISWYEAAAYAEYVGKTLPTIFQWEKAARAGRFTHFEDIVMPWGLMRVNAPSAERANYFGHDTAPVGSYPFGMSPYGTYDMGGNVEEWCVNERGPGRATAGGSWADEPYVFAHGGVRPAFDAANTIGFRCVSKPTDGAADQGSGRIRPKRSAVELNPVDDATYQGFLSHYRYDAKPLDAEIVETVDTPDWTREKLTFAGVEDNRIIAYLYLPKRAPTPYQCINYVVSSTVFLARTANQEVEALLAPQIKAGRAVMAVVPRGALEREWPGHTNHPAPGQHGTVGARAELILRVSEFRIGLDYLETRQEIDTSRIAHIGFSWGSWNRGPILAAVESRIRACIFIGGGVTASERLPEVNAINFVPRIRASVLVLTGKYDEDSPYEPSARALYELLQGPKQLALVESGHLPPVEIRNPIMSAFLDETLGPVTRRP